jgi:hypothetical protein
MLFIEKGHTATYNFDLLATCSQQNTHTRVSISSSVRARGGLWQIGWRNCVLIQRGTSDLQHKHTSFQSVVCSVACVVLGRV